MTRPTLDQLGAWTCPECDMANAPGRLLCGGCGYERDRPKPRRAAPATPGRAAAQSAGKDAGAGAKPARRAGKRPGTGRRNPPAPANDAEAFWLAKLRADNPRCTVYPQPGTLVAPDGDCHDPDIIVMPRQPGIVQLWQVKGSDQYPNVRAGRERHKRFALLYPGFEWHLAEKIDGRWFVDGEVMG